MPYNKIKPEGIEIDAGKVYLNQQILVMKKIGKVPHAENDTVKNTYATQPRQ